MEDSIVRGKYIVFCCKDRVIWRYYYLPSNKVKGISSRLEKNLEWEGKDPIVVVHIDAEKLVGLRRRFY